MDGHPLYNDNVKSFPKAPIFVTDDAIILFYLSPGSFWGFQINNLKKNERELEHYLNAHCKTEVLTYFFLCTKKKKMYGNCIKTYK